MRGEKEDEETGRSDERQIRIRKKRPDEMMKR